MSRAQEAKKSERVRSAPTRPSSDQRAAQRLTDTVGGDHTQLEGRALDRGRHLEIESEKMTSGEEVTVRGEAEEGRDDGSRRDRPVGRKGEQR